MTIYKIPLYRNLVSECYILSVIAIRCPYLLFNFLLSSMLFSLFKNFSLIQWLVLRSKEAGKNAEETDDSPQIAGGHPTCVIFVYVCSLLDNMKPMCEPQRQIVDRNCRLKDTPCFHSLD